jgi:hypothetical protein
MKVRPIIRRIFLCKSTFILPNPCIKFKNYLVEFFKKSNGFIRLSFPGTSARDGISICKSNMTRSLMLGFTSERMWHAFVHENLFSTQPFPERSRYHRRCRQLLQIIKRIRNFLLRRFTRQTPSRKEAYLTNSLSFSLFQGTNEPS